MQHVSNPWSSAIAAKVYDSLHTGSEDVPLLLSIAGEGGGPILEIGCGTGRCLIPVIRAGFDTVGIDTSKPMLERLQQKLMLESEDIRNRATVFPFDGITFQVPLRFGTAYMAADSFTHVLSKTDQEQLVANVFNHLRPGGLFVIDIFNPLPSFLAKSMDKTLQADGYAVHEERLSLDFAEQLVTLRTAYSGVESTPAIVWSFRYSYRFELEHLLEKAGFEVYKLCGDHHGTPFGEAIERIFIVARKPDDREMAASYVKEARALVPS